MIRDRHILGEPAVAGPASASRLQAVSAGVDAPLRYAGQVFVLAVACFVTGRIGTELASLSVVSAIWPAAGVALAGLLLLGMRVWPGVAVGGFLEVMSNGVSAPVALGVAAGQTLAPVVAVWLLRKVGFDDQLTRLVDVLALVAIGGLASNVITATVGTSFLLAGGFFSRGDWPLAWFVWWVGDVIGVLTVAPVLLALLRSAGAGQALAGERRPRSSSSERPAPATSSSAAPCPWFS